MTSSVRIDQVGLPAGTPGKSRTDGKRDGSLVTVTSTNPYATDTVVRLLWVPPGDTAALSSLTKVSATEWNFTPTVGVAGSYLIEVTENEGFPAQRVERRIFGVRTPKGLLIPALNERADSQATVLTPVSGASTEMSDDNSTDYPSSILNAFPFAGWYRKLHELFMAVEAGGGGGGGATSKGALGNVNTSNGFGDLQASPLSIEEPGGLLVKLKGAPNRVIIHESDGSTILRSLQGNAGLEALNEVYFSSNGTATLVLDETSDFFAAPVGATLSKTAAGAAQWALPAAGGSLQDAYEAGNVIQTAGGVPVVIRTNGENEPILRGKSSFYGEFQVFCGIAVPTAALPAGVGDLYVQTSANGILWQAISEGPLVWKSLTNQPNSTAQNNGTDLTQRLKLNFIPGSGPDVVATDNAALGRTDVYIPSAPAIATAAPVALTPSTGAVGVSVKYAKEDHRHQVTTGVPVALTPGGGNTSGSADSLARSDHTHSLPAYGSSAATICQGNDSRLSNDRTASGLRSATTVVEVNTATAPSAGQVLQATSSTAAQWTTLSIPTAGAAPADVTKATAAAGVAATFSRSDHKHDVATAAAGSLTPGGSNAEGISSSLARADHSHALPAYGTTAATICEGNDSRLGDDRTASGIRTASNIVSVSASAAPAGAGYILKTTAANAATWQPNRVVFQGYLSASGLAANTAIPITQIRNPGGYTLVGGNSIKVPSNGFYRMVAAMICTSTSTGNPLLCGLGARINGVDINRIMGYFMRYATSGNIAIGGWPVEFEITDYANQAISVTTDIPGLTTLVSSGCPFLLEKVE